MRVGRGVLPPLVIFVLAVLVPSVALSFLALRAAEREAMYVERRIEGALLAEVDLTARRIEALTGEITAELRDDFSRANPLAEVPFTMKDGRVQTDAGGPARERFMIAFGAFLQEGARLPVYDSIARVYRKEMGETLVRRADEHGVREIAAASSAPAPWESASAARDSAEAEYALPAPEKPPAEPEQALPAPTAAAAPAPPRQQAQRQIAPDSAAREKAFSRAAVEGFEIAKRNVAPQNRGDLAAAMPDERSETVSRGRTFEELLRESEGGLLPRLSDGTLDLLFWVRRADGTIAGCSVRMSALRARIAGVIPDVLSEVRVLTALDESGAPAVVPEPLPSPAPDWRRPFVAREISPLLPRWEAAAWLTDPALLTSRARSARLAVWALVAILLLSVAVGGGAVLRILSSEMCVAAQRTTFVANVSHELKTPLTSIRLFAELLLSGRQEDGERRREYLRAILSETERLSRLVEDVLAFSKRGKEKLQARPLSLADLARETAEQMRPHLEKEGFALSFGDEGAPLPIRGDSEALRRVIMNLLSNAEKYSGEGREIAVACRAAEGLAVVSVADRGIGVPPRFAEKIFQEFFRCDDSLASPKSGAGLGLAIARGIAREHGGDVSCEPREGGGSVFSLRLPLGEA